MNAEFVFVSLPSFLLCDSLLDEPGPPLRCSLEIFHLPDTNRFVYQPQNLAAVHSKKPDADDDAPMVKNGKEALNYIP
jgi:hypothetical protein